MERPDFIETAETPEEYRESLARAKKAFPALIRRLSNKVTPEETESLIEPDTPEFNPRLEYPTLFDLEMRDLDKKRRLIEENLATIHQIEEGGYTPSVIEEFDKQKANTGLANTNLLEAAQNIQIMPPLERDKAVEKFMIINEELNGPVNPELFQGVVNGLHNLIQTVKPTQPLLYKAAKELEARIPQEGGEEQIVSLLPDVFEAYSRTYHLIYDKWLNEIIPEGQETFNAEDIRAIFNKAMSSMGFEDGAELSEDTTSIKYRKEEQKFFIPTSRILKRDQLAAKLVHEMGHLTRGWNGAHYSSAAEAGLPDYLDAEEGLMSYGEEFITGKQQSNPTYIERYLGVGYMSGTPDGLKKDFKDTFAVMWRARLLLDNQALIGTEEDIKRADISAARKESLMNAQRIFRGGDGRIPGLGWTKDKVYYEGVAKLTQFLVDFDRRYGMEYIPILFAAKFDPTNSLHNRYLGMPLKG